LSKIFRFNQKENVKPVLTICLTPNSNLADIPMLSHNPPVCVISREQWPVSLHSTINSPVKGTNLFHFSDVWSVQLREIFAKVGVEMPCETFDRLYDIAAQRSPHQQVSVDTFRGVLEQAQEAAIHKYKDTTGY